MEPDATGFEPYRFPERINIKFVETGEGWKIFYHFVGMLYWGYKRERANEKMRKHGTYLEHETAVTEFREGLDEQDD